MMEASTPIGSTPALLRTQSAPLTGPKPPPTFQPLAEKFEAAFLAEMLKYTGLGKSQGAFSGGHGAQAFQSFLVDAYAQTLAETSSIGIADAVTASLAEQGESQ